MKKLKKISLFPKFIADLIEDWNYYIIEELAGPSLAKYINFSVKLDTITSLRIGLELMINIKVLHSSGIINGDLKEDNIVLLIKKIEIDNVEIHFSLIDFGFSHIIFDNDNKYISNKIINILKIIIILHIMLCLMD